MTNNQLLNQRDKAYWLARADLHAGYLIDLEDGALGKSDLWNSNMTVLEAIAVEGRNVTFCLKQAEEATA